MPTCTNQIDSRREDTKRSTVDEAENAFPNIVERRLVPVGLAPP